MGVARVGVIYAGGAAASMAMIREKGDSVLRWLVLALGCIALVGNYYCYDNPAALKTQLMADIAQLDESTFALTYSVYSLPSMLPVLEHAGEFRASSPIFARCTHSESDDPGL